MRESERTALFALVIPFVIATYIVLFLISQPPKHCRYFVPVSHHPGIYSCSEHPRPVNAR